MRLVARPAVTAVTFDCDGGELPMAAWLDAAAPGPGVLVLSGMVVVNMCVGDRIAAELVGAGDLIQSRPAEDDALLSCELSWRSLSPARFALLDEAFAQRVQPWPQITNALLRRAGRRAHDLDVQRAIASQPRLELRLMLLLWHLAGRWGRIEPGGVRLPLPLTHQLLGRLIGAERPSVSHALGRLTHAGLISGHSDEWHLHGSLDEQLLSIVEPTGAHAAAIVASVAPMRQR
ncbi:MAG TPA: Crp/Fnr family transcriptional regulator [Solirubrobacteraceae bacterium]|nr:Crp/Fnr family transcriptional regulator [Solirubrobacteraceae bacterium]